MPLVPIKGPFPVASARPRRLMRTEAEILRANRDTVYATRLAGRLSTGAARPEPVTEYHESA